MPRIPGINHRDAVRALQKVGFRVAREGKHVVMTDDQRILTIPRANPVNAYTMGGIVRDAGLTIAEFKKLLSPMYPDRTAKAPNQRVQRAGAVAW